MNKLFTIKRRRSVSFQVMNDRDLMQFLKTCPAFTGSLNVTDQEIVATFSNRDDLNFKSFYLEVEATGRYFDLRDPHQIVFPRSGKIVNMHVINLNPERRGLLSWIRQLRFSLR